jgi:hypothetical protein
MQQRDFEDPTLLMWVWAQDFSVLSALKLLWILHPTQDSENQQ